MSSLIESAFEARIDGWLAEHDSYPEVKVGNSGDGLHFEPRYAHGLLLLRSGRTASLAPAPGPRHPRAVEQAPGPAAPESRWAGLRARLEKVCALLRAPRWPSWCPRACPRHGSASAATLCWTAALRPALAEASRHSEMVDALRAVREVLEASTGAELEGHTGGSQLERLDPGRGS